MFRSLFPLIAVGLVTHSIFVSGKTTKSPSQKVKSLTSQGRAGVSPSLRPQTSNLKNSASTDSLFLASSSGIDSLYGYLEFRPSYTSKAGEFHTENTAEVGVKLNPTMKVGYLQWFSTNLMNNLPTTQGLNLVANDGFFYFKAKNILTSANQKLAAAYQLRLLTPTDSSKFNAGYRTGIRNQFQISYRYNDFIKTELDYRPTFHIYNRNSSLGSDGSSTINPSWEQQIVLNQEIHPADKVTVYLPIVYQVTTLRQEKSVSNSGKWKKLMVFLPEVDYDINPTHTVGFSYYSDNLISAYGSDLDLSNGFQKGVFQLIWGINL